MTYAVIYTIGLTATFIYLTVSLRAVSPSAVSYKVNLKAVWVANAITSAAWILVLPFLGCYAGVRGMGKILRIYKGY